MYFVPSCAKTRNAFGGGFKRRWVADIHRSSARNGQSSRARKAPVGINTGIAAREIQLALADSARTGLDHAVVLIGKEKSVVAKGWFQVIKPRRLRVETCEKWPLHPIRIAPLEKA